LKYYDFLKTKELSEINAGFECEERDLHDSLFDFQSLLVRWALKRGRAAIFADTGLGKTRMQLSWANAIHKKTHGSVLILAPLAVSSQTVSEASKMDMVVTYTREQPTTPGIYITNYEMLDHFDFKTFSGIVLDESSILKHQTSRYRNRIISMAQNIPYRLSATATPSPNDYMELGGQAEFLGIMSMPEMLAMYFTHDSGETSKWRLKGHGRVKFWEWLSTWAAVVKKPSDLGFSDERYNLPPLVINEHIVETGKILSGKIFCEPALSLSERNEARRITIEDRVKVCAELVNATNEPWIIWCNLNDESRLLTEAIMGAVEIKGSDKIESKEDRLMGFTTGKYHRLVTKPSIAGFGMNWQHCANMAFVGLNDSYEQLYQAIRRCYRFGQQRPVSVHLISSDIEGAVLENIKRKEEQAEHMSQTMVEYMRDLVNRNVKSLQREKTLYQPSISFEVPAWL
jgi:hypothetical protein